MGEPTPKSEGGMLCEKWIQEAAEEITKHVRIARSPCFQSTAELKIERAHKKGCAAVAAEHERCAESERAAVMFALGQAASAAADEVREDCGESIAQRVFHAVKAVARATAKSTDAP